MSVEKDTKDLEAVNGDFEKLIEMGYRFTRVYKKPFELAVGDYIVWAIFAFVVVALFIALYMVR
jgi:hypothetical protein